MDTGESNADLPEPRGSEHDDEPTAAAAHLARDGRDAIRVGDADRTAALSALDDHLGAGRLTIDEYGDRSAAASVAVTRADVAALFVDLPSPHPPLPGPPVPDEATPVPDLASPERGRRPHRFAAVPVVALALGVLLVLSVVSAFSTTGFHPGGLAFLPLLFVMVGGFRRRGPRR